MLDPQTSPPRDADTIGFAGDLGVEISRPAPGVAALSVRGEIDSLTTPRLESALNELLAEPADRYVLDLTEVSFLASSGLAVLIRTAQVTEERGLRLRLVLATRAVRRPLQITGSDQLFDLFDDLGTATDAPV